jgi:hypothetical protein
MHTDSILSSPLQRFIGHWRGEVTVSEGGGEPRTHTQDNSFAWVLGNVFLEERGRGSNGSSFLGLWSRDANHGGFVAHYFLAPSGDVVALRHQWDEPSQSFIGSAELGGGIRMLAKDRFIDANKYEWSLSVQDAAGGTLSQMRGLQHRVKC